MKIDVTKVSTRLNKSADQKPETVKPGTKCAVNKISKALITKRKNPIVTIVIGRVSNIRTGFTIEFIKARTAATIIAVSTPSIWTPGRSNEDTITAKALTTIWVRNFILKVLLNFVKVGEIQLKTELPVKT